MVPGCGDFDMFSLKCFVFIIRKCIRRQQNFGPNYVLNYCLRAHFFQRRSPILIRCGGYTGPATRYSVCKFLGISCSDAAMFSSLMCYDVA